MKCRDTLHRIPGRQFRTLFTGEKNRQELELENWLRFKFLGLYERTVGPESNTPPGQPESESLHRLELVRGGLARVIHQGAVCELEPGWAYWLPGNTPVERTFSDRFDVVFLEFCCEWLAGDDPFLDWPERKPARLGPWSSEWLEPVLRGAKLTASFLLRLRGQLAGWIADAVPDLDRILRARADKVEPFRKVLETIDQRLAANLRVRDLAAAYKTNPRTLSQAFSRRLGMPIKAYLNRRLNEEAIRLVLGTNSTLADITDKLRFSDEYYFNRFFAKMNGVSPGRYRDRYQRLPAGIDGVGCSRRTPASPRSPAVGATPLRDAVSATSGKARGLKL